MIIIFKTSKLKKIFNDDDLLKRKYGNLYTTIRRRLDDIDSADNLSIIGKLPPHRCHEMKGDRKGQLSIDLIHPYRLIFEPADNPPAIKPDGGIDWENVRTVKIIEITDYH